MQGKYVLVLLTVAILASGMLVAYGYNIQYTSQSTLNLPLVVRLLTHASSAPIYVNITSSTYTGLNYETDPVLTYSGNSSVALASFATTESYPVKYTTTRYLISNLTTNTRILDQCLSGYKLLFRYMNGSTQRVNFCIIDAQPYTYYIDAVYTNNPQNTNIPILSLVHEDGRMPRLNTQPLGGLIILGLIFLYLAYRNNK